MSQQINLFNPVFLKQKKIFSALALLQASGMVLAGAGLVAGYAVFQSTGLNKNAATVSAQLHAAEAQAARLRAEAGAAAPDKALEQELSRLEAEIKARQQIASILQNSDFGNTRGYSAYMAAFARQIPEGLWLTSFSIAGAGSEIGLQGRTLKPELLPLYVNRLRRERVMQGKSFGALQMHVPRDESQASPGSGQDGGKRKERLPYVKFLEFNLSSTPTQEKADAGGGKNK